MGRSPGGLPPDQLSSIQPIKDAAAPGSLGLREFLRVFNTLWVSGSGDLVLVYGPDDRAEGAGCQDREDVGTGPSAGFLKILPVFLMVLPGVIGYVLFRKQIGNDNDATLMVMMKELLPTGVRGLMAAGLLAALMSTIQAALNRRPR